MQPRIAITGMGIVGPFGSGTGAFRGVLRTAPNLFRVIQRAPSSRGGYVIAPLPELEWASNIRRIFPRAEAIAARVARAGHRASRVVQAGLLAVSEAWIQAGMPEDGELTSLVVGGQNLMGAQEHAWLPRLADEPSYVSPQAAIRLLDSDVVGSVSEAFGLMGEGSLVGGASASGNLAIVQACRLLRSGRSERCVVLGALAELSALQLQAFCNIGALGGRDFLEDPGSACRPFDRKQGGFIPGEASACLILEREEAALARGIEPHAYVLGGAATLHGDHGADASAAAILRAMRLACEDAAVSPASIDYINAHATGTPRGDAAELSAIRELLGRRIGDVPINSTKSIVGHCLWSAGVVEAIAVVLQMSGKFIHPNRNLCEPTEAGIALVGEQAIAADASLALSNSMGFGGIDTTVVIGQCRRSAPSLPR